MQKERHQHSLCRPPQLQPGESGFDTKMRESCRIKFLIVGNGRTGSTWLETMLGCLPEVAVDYELKWNPVGYDLLPHLKVIPNRPSSCGDLLLELSQEAPIVGSKLILDKRSYSPSEYADLHHSIDRDIRIIHLVRDYYDVVLSWYRGVYHVLNETAASQESEQKTEIYKSIAKGNTSENLSFFKKTGYAMNHLRNFVQTRDLLPIMQLLNRHGLANFDTSERELGKFRGDLEHCLGNDMWTQTLRQTHPNYCILRYTDIPKSFASIARFIGSQASDSIIQEILDNPISKKLPPKDVELLCSSPDRLKNLCHEYNQRRDSFLET